MPPILVTDFSSRQTNTHVYISVKWPAPIVTRNTDIYANDVYLKIHANPFLFHMDLAQPIDEETASCTIRKDERLFNLSLPKRTPNVDWDELQLGSTTRQDLNDRRNAASARHVAKLQQMREKNKADRWDLDRYLVRQQISIEQSERQYVDELKLNEEQIALKSLDDAIESSDDDDSEIQALRLKYTQVSQQEPIRDPGHIEIQFTERKFVSAARETQDAKWMAQMEESRRTQRTNDDVIKLLDKASSFQAQGQWTLAIDAYSALMAISPDNHKIYVGRCECYAQLDFFELAAKDALRALHIIREMEAKHDLRGVYDQVKIQLQLHINAALLPSDAA